MTQTPGPQPRLDVRGAVDLSSLGRPATPRPAPGASPTGPGAAEAAGNGGVGVDVTEAEFAAVVQRSFDLPVVVVLWSPRSPESVSLLDDVAAEVVRSEGRLLLARVDVDAVPQIAAAFQVQAVPAAVAVLQGQPVPLFQGRPALAELRTVLEQVLQAAIANGLTGRVAVPSAAVEAVEAAEASQEEEPPLPPLHQAAYDAIERDDLDAAAEAYRRALVENPRDQMATEGLAQVGLMARTRDLDPSAVRRRAADAPQDVEAQLAVADLDVLGGALEDAFARLVDTVRSTAGPEREQVRVRLIELFAVVGDADPRVLSARRALASALY